MSICLCTLVLNEMEWLPKLYEQHKNWPDLTKWVFVESADQVYAEANPTLVSHQGLSTDGTTEWLRELSQRDPRVVHIRHGITWNKDPAQGKCAARQRYLNEMEAVEPEFFVVLDADEFYPQLVQGEMPRVINQFPQFNGFCFKHREIWHPPSVASEPLFKYEVTGGFWGIPYCRTWRWFPNLQYKTNHNTPEVNGELLDSKLKRMDYRKGMPEFIHMGFASNPEIRAAKNKYYVARGEGKTDHRQWYVDSRACFETWKPGDKLPKDAKVIPYTGPIPEAFLKKIDPTKELTQDTQSHPYEFDIDMAGAFRETMTKLVLPQANEPIQYLEIGVYQGRSGCWMLDNALLHPKSTYTGIDLNIQPEAYRNFQYHPNATLIQGSSATVLPILQGEYDVIYVDGNHSREAALIDIQESWRLLKVGGLLVCDDYSRCEEAYGVIDAVSEFLATLDSTDYKVEFKSYQIAIRRLK